MASEDLAYEQEPSAGAVGFRYETKVITYAALKLYYDKGCERFVLGTNLTKAGKFDDIVFKFKTNGQTESWFIQLKHSKNKEISLSRFRSETGNKDFYLRKYYESFEQLKKLFKSKNRQNFGKLESDIFRGNFGTTRFIIFTNEELDDNLKKTTLERKGATLLSTNTKEELNVKLTPQVLKEGKDNFNLGKHEDEFFNHLMLCTGQAGEGEMDHLIEHLIQESEHLREAEANIITAKLLQFIDKWSKTNKLLTKEELHKKLNKFKLQIIGLNPGDIGVEYRQEFLSSFRDRCSNAQIVAVVCELDNVLLSKEAVKQSTTGSYMTLTLHQLVDMREPLSAEQNTLLIVDCETQVSDINLKVLYNSIVDFARSNRVLLVVPGRSNKMAEFITQCKATQVDFSCSLQDFTDACKELVLEADIKFQGRTVQLANLISGNEPLTDLDVLTKLLKGQDVEVGVPPPQSIPYYVTRLLLRYPYLNPNFFKTKKKLGTFALSQTTMEEVKKIASDRVYTVAELEGHEVKFVWLEDEGELEDVKKKLDNVHWISKEGKSWKWRGSTGENVQGITTLTSTRAESTNTKDFLSLERTTVLTAEPGMGKTTLTHHMALEMKEDHPTLWVIIVPLNNFTHMFQDGSWFTATEQQVKLLLRTAAGVNDARDNELKAVLFEQCYSSLERNRMVVLLDGFDEVYLEYKDAVWHMLQVLQASNVFKIWVSARPTLKDILQSKLCTLSYSLKPFEREDQKKFFMNFWRNKHQQISRQELEKFIEELLKMLNRSVADAEQFTGIPLQTRMVSEAFDDNMTEYVTTKELSLPKRINILQLFDRFVETKYKILRDEKAKIDSSNSMARQAMARSVEASQADVMTMALIVLLPHTEWNTVNPPITESVVDQMKQKILNNEERSGIVDRFETLPHFLHRTFAEYFAAKFLASNIERNHPFLKSKVFLSDSFSFVRHLFDRLLAQELPLHNAILDDDLDVFDRLLQELTQADLGALDKGGRSALHLAAASRKHNTEFVSNLLKVGLCTTSTDMVYLWTPLKYALALNQSLYSIGALMEHGGGSDLAIVRSQLIIQDELVAVKTAVLNDHLALYSCLEIMEVIKNAGNPVLRTWTWLESADECSNLTLHHLAARYGAVKILGHVLSKQPQLIESRDSNRKTCLHYAVESGSKDAVCLLLKHKADPTAEDAEEKTCLHYAVTQNNIEVLELMLQALKKMPVKSHDKALGTIVPLLSASSEPSWLDALYLVLRLFPKSNDVVGPKGMSPLATAAQKGHTRALHILLDAGANVNLTMKHDYTALHYAAMNGEVEAARMLTDKTLTNIEVREIGGETPLYMSVSRGHTGVFHLLLEKGADWRTKNNHGNTLLHALAVPGSDPNILNLLLERGVDKGARNKEGRTALDLLRLHHGDEGIKSMIDLLEALEPASVGEKGEDKVEEQKTPSAESSTSVDMSEILKLVNNMSEEEQLALLSLLEKKLPVAPESRIGQIEKKENQQETIAEGESKNKKTQETNKTDRKGLQTAPESDNKLTTGDAKKKRKKKKKTCTKTE